MVSAKVKQGNTLLVSAFTVKTRVHFMFYLVSCFFCIFVFYVGDFAMFFILLFKMALKCGAEVLASVPMPKKNVIYLMEKICVKWV